MTPKRQVLQHHPTAFCARLHAAGNFVIDTPTRMQSGGCNFLGMGRSAKAAWNDASKNLGVSAVAPRTDMWQIVHVSDLTNDFKDLSNEEIAELQHQVNTICQGSREQACAYAKKILAENMQEVVENFYPSGTTIVFTESVDSEGNWLMEALIDDEVLADVTVYPVPLIKLDDAELRHLPMTHQHR
jgi:hypothetical protein